MGLFTAWCYLCSNNKLENLFPIVCFWNKSSWMGAVSKKKNIKFRLCSFKGNTILVEAAKVAANFKHLFFRKMATVRNCARNLITRKKGSSCLLLPAAWKGCSKSISIHFYVKWHVLMRHDEKEGLLPLFWKKKSFLRPSFLQVFGYKAARAHIKKSRRAPSCKERSPHPRI